MRRFLPDVGDEDLDDLYLDLGWPSGPPDRPYLYLDMVASADGAATSAGRTGPLGGEADHLAFPRLREWCDAIVVGASTVRVEDYGPPRPRAEGRRRRAAQGLAEVPRLVVLTATARLDPAARLFADADHRPIVIAPDAADTRHLEPVADVVTLGEERVDLAAAMRWLREAGYQRALCEGGPHLNAQLFADDLVDELFLTIAPTIVGASHLRIVTGTVGDDRPLHLVELREHRGELLLRYRVRR